MRQLLKNRRKVKICISIVEPDMARVLRSMKIAENLGDLIEVRGDYIKYLDIKGLINIKKLPLIFTNRKKEEGGRGKCTEKEIFNRLKEAIDLGVDYIDLGLRCKKEYLMNLIENKKETKIILSYHDFDKTPSIAYLLKIFGKTNQLKPDFLKIVTYARSYEDNIRILSLIPYAKSRKQRIITFAMGYKGRISRIISPIIGSAWTYASLENGKRSAPGQINVLEMKEVYKILGCY